MLNFLKRSIALEDDIVVRHAKPNDILRLAESTVI